VGSSLGIGRIGSILGPVIGGELIQLNWSNADLFIAVAVPAVISSIVLILLARKPQLTPREAREPSNAGARQ